MRLTSFYNHRSLSSTIGMRKNAILPYLARGRDFRESRQIFQRPQFLRYLLDIWHEHAPDRDTQYKAFNRKFFSQKIFPIDFSQKKRTFSKGVQRRNSHSDLEIDSTFEQRRKKRLSRIYNHRSQLTASQTFFPSKFGKTPKNDHFFYFFLPISQSKDLRKK